MMRGARSKRQLLGASFLAVVFLGKGCGAPLVDVGYRGEPLFEVDGQIETFSALEPADEQIRASLFWTTGRFLEEPSAQRLLEQASASTEVRFPATFEIRIFEPPTQRHFIQLTPPLALGVVLIYADRNGNERYDAMGPDVIVGGTVAKGIVYAPQGAPSLMGTDGEGVPPGFSLLSFQFICGLIQGMQMNFCDMPEVCPPDWACDPFNERCVPPGGQFCDQPNVCPPGLVCHNETRDCLPPPTGEFCATPEVCPPEMICDPIIETCLPPEAFEFCSREPEVCPEGFFCDPIAQDCIPAQSISFGCREVEDCPPEHVCDAFGQTCVPDGPLKLRIEESFSVEQSLCEPGI